MRSERRNPSQTSMPSSDSLECAPCISTTVPSVVIHRRGVDVTAPIGQVFLFPTFHTTITIEEVS